LMWIIPSLRMHFHLFLTRATYRVLTPMFCQVRTHYLVVGTKYDVILTPSTLLLFVIRACIGIVQITIDGLGIIHSRLRGRGLSQRRVRRARSIRSRRRRALVVFRIRSGAIHLRYALRLTSCCRLGERISWSATARSGHRHRSGHSRPSEGEHTGDPGVVRDGWRQRPGIGNRRAGQRRERISTRVEHIAIVNGLRFDCALVGCHHGCVGIVRWVVRQHVHGVSVSWVMLLLLGLLLCDVGCGRCGRCWRLTFEFRNMRRNDLGLPFLYDKPQ